VIQRQSGYSPGAGARRLARPACRAYARCHGAGAMGRRDRSLNSTLVILVPMELSADCAAGNRALDLTIVTATTVRRTRQKEIMF
jgi:hypothetical protein